MTEKKPLFSLTAKDFEIQTFRSGGKGGQHQNKTESGVRIIHAASGAVGEARDSRDQHQNKRNAFTRLAESDKFKAWHKVECAKRMGLLADVESNVKKLMEPHNMKIETLVDDRWVPIVEGERKEE